MFCAVVHMMDSMQSKGIQSSVLLVGFRCLIFTKSVAISNGLWGFDLACVSVNTRFKAGELGYVYQGFLFVVTCS